MLGEILVQAALLFLSLSELFTRVINAKMFVVISRLAD